MRIAYYHFLFLTFLTNPPGRYDYLSAGEFCRNLLHSCLSSYLLYLSTSSLDVPLLSRALSIPSIHRLLGLPTGLFLLPLTTFIQSIHGKKISGENW